VTFGSRYAERAGARALQSGKGPAETFCSRYAEGAGVKALPSGKWLTETFF
jgi:hypothetical protein